MLLTLCLVLTMVACLKWNSLSVTRELSLDREAVLKLNLENLAKKLRAAERRLVVLQKESAEGSGSRLGANRGSALGSRAGGGDAGQGLAGGGALSASALGFPANGSVVGPGGAGGAGGVDSGVAGNATPVLQ
jgi:hypothetical protein